MYYVGLAKRIASSFFPRVVPVPQLQPLDARKIFYASDEEVWKVTLVWAEASSSDNEWTAFLAWEDASSSDEAWAAFLEREEAKVQEREAKTAKAASPSGDYDIYDPSTWPPYVWPAKPAAVRCKKPYDAHLASLLAAPAAAPAPAPAPAKKSKPSLFGDDEDAPKRGVPALKGKLGNLNFMIPSASRAFAATLTAAKAPAPLPAPAKKSKPSLFGDDDIDLFEPDRPLAVMSGLTKGRPAGPPSDAHDDDDEDEILDAIAKKRYARFVAAMAARANAKVEEEKARAAIRATGGSVVHRAAAWEAAQSAF